MLVVPLLNVQILARGSFPTVETKPVFFFFLSSSLQNLFR